MNIIGLDALVFGVDDVAATTQYLTDFGLTPVGANAAGGRFEALDGTALVIAHKDDPALPPSMGTAAQLRKIVFGVADEATLDAIASELGRDREVRRLEDGSLEANDDQQFVLGFQVTVRRPLDLPAELVNAPGSKTQRAPNELGLKDENAKPTPRTLSHLALFTPDAAAGEAFYVNRLGFRVTDRLIGAGPFLQPGGTLEHHAVFLINTPPHMKGIEHLAFHLGGPNEVMLAGKHFAKKGYQSFWGPGRHIMGSNWFWYFNSPLGCRVEYDADMDLHDRNWVPRAEKATIEATQAYLLEAREKWAPLGGPPGEKH
jgi:catechol 2,3-dioxygenase-like lactoylglutathione lyase family enzyme